MSEQKAKPKTSSTVRRINSAIQLKQLWRFLSADFFIWVFGSVGACAAVEFSQGVFRLSAERVLSLPDRLRGMEAIRSVSYVIADGAKRCTVPMGAIAYYAGIAMLVFFCLQLLGWIFDWGKQNTMLRKYMRPLDELAMTAERLSSEGINWSKMQDLEEAIDHITGSDNSISIGDSDLMGLENAINNLLKRLRASYQEQTRFVDDASHELRTPIAVIQGYASMLERWGMDDRATLEEAVHAIHEESTHMKELVDQLLFLARGDGGRQHLKMEEIQAEELMKEICEESEMIDPHHRYMLRTSGSYTVQADRAMLKQAIRILADNAAKYTPEGGRITLRLDQPDGGMASFGVQDEGIGVEREEAAKMFERFFRGDGVRGSTKGSGLGLSIAKWIVDRHSGTIEVLSYKDVGTRMTIRVPVSKPTV